MVLSLFSNVLRIVNPPVLFLTVLSQNVTVLMGMDRGILKHSLVFGIVTECFTVAVGELLRYSVETGDCCIV